MSGWILNNLLQVILPTLRKRIMPILVQIFSLPQQIQGRLFQKYVAPIQDNIYTLIWGGNHLTQQHWPLHSLEPLVDIGTSKSHKFPAMQIMIHLMDACNIIRVLMADLPHLIGVIFSIYEIKTIEFASGKKKVIVVMYTCNVQQLVSV